MTSIATILSKYNGDERSSLEAYLKEVRIATIEECAKAIEDYHAGPQAVGRALAGVILKLKSN